MGAECIGAAGIDSLGDCDDLQATALPREAVFHSLPRSCAERSETERHTNRVTGTVVWRLVWAGGRAGASICFWPVGSIAMRICVRFEQLFQYAAADYPNATNKLL